MMVFGMSGLCWRVDLSLKSCLDNVEGTGNDTGKTTSCSTSEKLEGNSDIAALFVFASPSGELFPEHELQS